MEFDTIDSRLFLVAIMRLSFRLFVLLGVMLVIVSSIQPALASSRSTESFPLSQAPDSSVVFEHLTIEDGLSQNAGLAWVQAGTRWYASYTNLTGGDYVFRVKGSNSDGSEGIWNEAGISIPITVIPPFWQTWWFTIGIIIVFSGVIAFGFQWRVMEIRASTRRLENLVEQRTMEMRESNTHLGVEVEQHKRAEEVLARRAAEELERSEARFRAMFEHAGIGMVGFDRRQIVVNIALVIMTGYSAKELFQMTGADLSYPEDADIGIPELQDV